MELRELRCFAVLAEELHFARAAQRLGLAQSGVSRLLAGLETDLGGKLFNRGKRSQVTLTTTGMLFLPEARAILQQAEYGGSIGRRATGRMGTAVVTDRRFMAMRTPVGQGFKLSQPMRDTWTVSPLTKLILPSS